MKTLLLNLALILLATAAGAQTTWYEIPTGTTKKLNTIHFPSSSVGYIGGNDSILLKSTDNGETWNEVPYTGVTFVPGGANIVNLKFVSETTGYMTVGPYTGVYKTTDGGLTWTPLTPAGNLCYNEGLFFFDEQNGFLGGAGCFQGETIEKMTDGTLATTTINTPSWDAADLVVDIDFLDADFGLAASYGGRILRTTDGGLNWDTIPSSLGPDYPLTGIAVIDDTLAYASYSNLGSGFGLLRTIDGGLTWAEDFNSATFAYPAFLCVHEATNGNVYSGAQPSWGTGGMIFENTGPDAWAFYDTDHPINDMGSHSSNTVFGVGDSGLVVVNQLPSTLSVAAENNLDQNLLVYPNPVNDLLTIQVPQGLNGEHATLYVYAASGELIYEAVYTPTNAADLSSFSPGLYLVELRSENARLHTYVIKE
jgi:photosystem II stability/assembly factor-like uncharacterized protein